MPARTTTPKTPTPAPAPETSLPSTSAAHPDRAVDVAAAEDRVAREARNLLLLRLVVGSAALLAVSFALLVGSGARAHGIDHELSSVWWSHHAEYDCCTSTNERCARGVSALTELRERLRGRDGSLRERVAARAADALGLADLDVSQAPTDLARVDQVFATCPALARAVTH